jgi:hypothetical protein
MRRPLAEVMLLSVEAPLLKHSWHEALALLIGYLVIGGAVFLAVCWVAAWILWHLSGFFGGQGGLFVIGGVVGIGYIGCWISDYRRARKKRLLAKADLTE